MATGWRGVFTIPVTPFTDDGEVDTTSLKRCVEFCVRCGAHGVVAPVNASEAPLLSEDERRRVSTLIVETVGGRVPVVVGVSAMTERQSLDLARLARDAGADAVIAMPPYARRGTQAEIEAFFKTLVDVGLPVFVQNYAGALGTPMSAAQVASLVKLGANYVKEETLPAGHLMTALVEQVGDQLQGIMGGMAGRFLLDEFRRGACGTMPACEVTDVHVAIWNALDAGDLDRARTLHTRLLPLLNIEWLYGTAIYKEVLRRRGVIACAAGRGPGAVTLDHFDHRELDAILADVQPLFSAGLD